MQTVDQYKLHGVNTFRANVLTQANTLNRLEPDPDKGSRALRTPSGTAAFRDSDRVLVYLCAAVLGPGGHHHHRRHAGAKAGTGASASAGNTSFPFLKRLFVASDRPAQPMVFSLSQMFLPVRQNNQPLRKCWH